MLHSLPTEQSVDKNHSIRQMDASRSRLQFRETGNARNATAGPLANVDTMKCEMMIESTAAVYLPAFPAVLLD